MGSGATKEKCQNAGFYKEEFSVGEEDQGLKIFDLHGSGMATFFLGFILGAGLMALLLSGLRKMGLSCGRRRHQRVDKGAAEAAFKQREDAIHLFGLPPVHALPALQHFPLPTSIPAFGHQHHFDHPRREAPSPRFSEIPSDSTSAPGLQQTRHAQGANVAAPSLLHPSRQPAEVEATPLAASVQPLPSHTGHMA